MMNVCILNHEFIFSMVAEKDFAIVTAAVVKSDSFTYLVLDIFGPYTLIL